MNKLLHFTHNTEQPENYDRSVGNHFFLSVLSAWASAAGSRAEQGFPLTNCLLGRKSVQGLTVGRYNCCFACSVLTTFLCDSLCNKNYLRWIKHLKRIWDGVKVPKCAWVRERVWLFWTCAASLCSTPFNRIIYNEQMILKPFGISLQCCGVMDSRYELWLGNFEARK